MLTPDLIQQIRSSVEILLTIQRENNQISETSQSISDLEGYPMEGFTVKS
jgi:hypothetical protein